MIDALFMFSRVVTKELSKCFSYSFAFFFFLVNLANFLNKYNQSIAQYGGELNDWDARLQL
jgi:lipopolysaccharide export LptBFGC system permease protein LptF